MFYLKNKRIFDNNSDRAQQCTSVSVPLSPFKAARAENPTIQSNITVVAFQILIFPIYNKHNTANLCSLLLEDREVILCASAARRGEGEGGGTFQNPV